MPFLYGEGGPKAFERLQEEIIKRNLDQSFLVQMGFPDPFVDRNDIPLFAQSPSCFQGCENVFTTSETVAPFSLNNQGLQLRTPIFQIPGERNRYIAVLACVQGIGSTQRLGLPLRAIERTGTTLVRETTAELCTVSEAALWTASTRNYCILRQVPIAVPRLLSIRVIQDWEVIYRAETLYQEDSKDQIRGWQRLEAGRDAIKIPPPDGLNLKSPCYGVVFTNPYTYKPRDERRRQPWPASPSSKPGRGVCKILVRVDLDATSRYSATVSVHHFWDEDWIHCHDLGIVPNCTVFHITPAKMKTLDLSGDKWFKKLIASISWKRNAGQDVLRLDIKIIDSTIYGRIKAIFPSFECPPATTDILLYLAALTYTAMVIHHFTQLEIFHVVAFLARLGLTLISCSSFRKMDVGPPGIWGTAKWALCFPAFALVWPMQPNVIHWMMLMIWPVHQEFFSFEGKYGMLVGFALLFVGAVLKDLAQRWAYHTCSTIGLQILSTMSEYYGLKWRESSAK